MKKILIKADFDAEIAGAGGRIVLFYSAWCPFCVSFLPVFEKAAAVNPPEFAQVCIDDLPALEESFDVEVVPTVLFFKSGALKKRLDGVLGRGLNGEDLSAFVKACGAAPKKP